MVKIMAGLVGLASLVAAGVALRTMVATAEPSVPNATTARRPIALALIDDGRRLLVANRDSGTIAIVDLDTRTIDAETPVGRKLSDVVASKTGGTIFATDEAAGELILLAKEGKSLREIARRSVGMTPVIVRLNDDGTMASVACLWPQRLVLVDVAALQAGKQAADNIVIDLPFAPRRQLIVPGMSKLIVADAFGGRLAVVDWASKKIESVRDLGVHNIRGLAFDPSGKHLLLAHQFLNSTAPTQKGNIQNGNLLSNRVGKLSLVRLLGGSGQSDDRVYQIGDIERGAGDPADIAVDAAGRALVALAGVDEFAIGRLDDVIWTRIPVGRRPSALAYDAVRRRAYVAHTFDDSISIIDCGAGKRIAEIPLGPKIAALSSQQRGELLFHDARRSHDAWMSCQSCHPDGYTNGRLNDNFSDGSFGTPKRVLSLLGVKDTGPWAWNGGMASLEDQVRNSFQSTMQGPPPSDDDVRDVTAYLRTLAPPPSLAQARGHREASSRDRGARVFERLGCVNCHRPATFTTARSYAVGLEGDGGFKFNPPSLRGVSQGGPYFHDNRALSLEEVVTRYRHQIAEPLPAAEVADLISYLKSL